ncbi:MAG: tetratricopeptide repeat protein [Chloroflexi bacterium]|nr:tetratricopeptide repeat protein [Chloroflexota bacterium]
MIGKTLQNIQIFLGPARVRIFIVWFALTGLASLVLNAVVNQYNWVRPVQSLIVIAFLIGTGIIIGGRLSPGERGRWAGILTPALIAVLIALLIAPQYSAALIGGALGWIVAGLLLTRSRMPMAYKEAVRYLRKNQYEQAVKVMDRVIKEEPGNPNHYRFRAEVLRVWGKLDRAIRDYRKMTELAPESALAFNGLAEVYLQVGKYADALEAARKANQLAPDDWVTYYNLGMIEDRLKQSAAVVEHLQRALALKVKEKRHRALIHFYLARAYSRLGDEAAAREQVKALKGQFAGLEEWETILRSDQADTLRAVLGADVQAAQALAADDIGPTALKEG